MHDIFQKHFWNWNSMCFDTDDLLNNTAVWHIMKRLLSKNPDGHLNPIFFLLYPVYQDELAASYNYLKALTALTTHQRRSTLNSALPDGLFHFYRGNGNGVVHWLLQLNRLHCLHNFQQEHLISVILEPLELAEGQRKHVCTQAGFQMCLKSWLLNLNGHHAHCIFTAKLLDCFTAPPCSILYFLIKLSSIYVN